jgi:hypothetical protein
MKKLLFFIAIFVITLSPAALRAQHLFSVKQNDLSKENVTQLKKQIAQSEIASLSLTRNNEDRNVYSVSLSSVENAKIIILNEQTGSNVVITPAETRLIASLPTEFQLAPFFIEELKQGALGDASRYLIVETRLATSLHDDFSIQNVVAVSVSNEEVYIPQFFYGKKEDVKEALPKDRQIIHIFKQKPSLILAYPDDPELQRYAAQYEEENSYYVYMYKLPDGTLCTYDENLNPVSEENAIAVGEQLQFTLTGNLNTTQLTPTLYALKLWGQKLSGSVPIKIYIESKPLGTGILGSSTPMQHVLNNGQVPECPTNTYYHGSIWNQLVGYPAASGLNIKLAMNSTFNFYYDTIGNPTSGKTDWVTVMLHEVNHGLGFAAAIEEDGRYYYIANDEGGGYYTNYPNIFTRQLYQGTTGSCITDLTQAERAALIKSNNLYAGTPDSYLVASHGGDRVRMYAPLSYQPGSSVSHWGNSPGFTTFMKYSIGAGPGSQVRTISSREIGIFRDMGWKIYDPNPIFVNCYSNEGEGNMPQQQFIIGVAQYLKANAFTNKGYMFSKWTTEPNGTGTSYQNKQIISISTDLELYAQWEVAKYTLTFNPGNNGTVEISEMQVSYGQPIGELPVPVRPGSAFKEWKIGTTTINEEYIWNFEDNREATAVWGIATYTITATATPGGKISPAGDATVLGGTNKTYKITPLQDYFITDVLVDDESVGAVPEYTFENIVASHTIHAVFSGVGINETEYANTIQIIPNPTTGQLRVTSDELQVTSVEVFDIMGLNIFSPPVARHSSLVTIDIAHLPAGIYFVKIETEQGFVTKKVIKN